MTKEKYFPLTTGSSSAWSLNSRIARRGRYWVLLAILVVGVFYFSTIRSGHVWGDDFAMYIRHAINLAEGTPYNQTGYIPNPRLSLAPEVYPPIFPLLLVPIYKFLGLNLIAMKIEVILFLLLSLWMIYLALKNELELTYLLAILVLTGLNPDLWQLKDAIVSDIPYLFFNYLSLALIRKTYETNRAAKEQTLYGILTGISIYLSYGTRTVGATLLVALVIYDLLKNRRPSLFMAIAALVAFALIYLQNLGMTSDAINAYSNQLSDEGESLSHRLQVMGYHCYFLLQKFAEFWENGYSRLFRWGVFVLISVAAGLGYLLRLRKFAENGILEIFLLVYLGPLIILPIELETRYLLPVLPLILLYAFTSLRGLSRRLGYESGAFGLVIILILAAYLGQYSTLDLKSVDEGIGKAETQQLFDFITRETAKSDVLLFRKPRALNLFTGRTGAVWHREPNDEKLWNYFRQINATYLITGSPKAGPEEQEFIRGFVERNRDRLEETFQNADFHVYRLHRGAMRGEHQ